MGIGVVALQTSQKREQAGPPFASNSADNGTSVDSTSGHIVLGNDVGDPAAPAALLSNREIITEDALLNLFSILLNSIQTGIGTLLNGQIIQVFSANGNAPTITATDSASGFPNITASVSGGLGGLSTIGATAAAGDVAQLSVARGGTDTLSIRTTGSGTVFFLVGNTVQVWAVDTSTFNQQAGPGLMAFNGAAFQINGDLTHRLFLQSQGAGNYNVNRDLDSNKQFFNTAANTLTLPNMVGANDRPGFILRVNIQNVAGTTIQMSAGQVLRFGSLSSTSGGTLSSTDVGAYVMLVWDSTNWVAASFTGAWSLT